MASIERTACPRFKRSPTPQQLHALYTPTKDELAFARKTMRSPISQLSLLVLLKSFQQLGYFPKLKPSLKIIAASGLKADGKAAEADHLGVTSFLQKPYTVETLLRTVAAKLKRE